jgi:hypothetical protein
MNGYDSYGEQSDKNEEGKMDNKDEWKQPNYDDPVPEWFDK